MKRAVCVMIALVTLFNPSIALAGGSGGVEHGTEVVTGAPLVGQVDVAILARSIDSYGTVIKEERCWYPQAWADDVIVNGNASDYYAVVGDLIDDMDRWFSSEVPEIGGNSCIQHAYNYFGSCTDEERIAVRAIDVLWDVRNATIGSFGDIGLHEFPERYCVEIIDIDRWRQIIRASEFLPKPVRATYPQYRTLVGLENETWYEVEEGQDRYVDGFYVELPTPGTTYNVDVSLWLAEIAIDIDGDGEWDRTVTCSTGEAESLIDCGGSLEDPILTFEYEQRAYHHFVIESRWAGEAIDEEGIVHILDPGYLSVQLVFDWETVEVRSSLDG